MSTENNPSKCASCVCTGCHNFKNNDDKEAQLLKQKEITSQTSKQ